jgi:Bifunctional DNA primase/polymerase, N-terminal/AAA domain
MSADKSSENTHTQDATSGRRASGRGWAPIPLQDEELIGQYLEEGLKLLKLRPETKRPVGKEWQHKPGLTLDQALGALKKGYHLGTQVGEVSGWIACVDNDAPEAVKLAQHFLPPTLTAGKGGIPSHYVYYVPGMGYSAFSDIDQDRLIDVKASNNGRGHQFVVAPSIHPEKGPYEWIGGFDPASIERVDPAELREAVGNLAASALVARHLPARGRHDYSLPLAGYLLRNGLDEITTTRILRGAWWCQDAPREGQEAVGRNVADTAVKLKRGEPVKGGRTLEELVPGMPRKLADFLQLHDATEDEGEETNPLLAGRVDLGAAMSRGIDPPDELEPDILLSGKIHHLFGPSESGKTIIALWMVKRRIEARERVVLFDAENGPRTISERLKQMGVDPKLVSEYLIYLPFPDLTLGERGRQDFYSMLDRVKPVLIIFDSWASFLSSAGFSENENSEIEHWDNAITKKAKDRGIASAILDHTPHDLDRSRGGARKKEVADVQWQVKKTQDFDRDCVGEVLLIQHKDREGWLPPTVKFSVGGSLGELICARSAGTFEDASGADGMTPRERKVLDTLCEEFALTGARQAEWQRATNARGVSRMTHYRAVKKLVSPEVSSAHRVRRVNDTYYPPERPDPPDSDDTPENPVGKPDSARYHEVSVGYHDTSDTPAEEEVSPVSPPYKGETVIPPADTNGASAPHTPRGNVAALVEAVFEEGRGGPAVNLPLYLAGQTTLAILTNSVLEALRVSWADLHPGEREGWERAVERVVRGNDRDETGIAEPR